MVAGVLVIALGAHPGPAQDPVPRDRRRSSLSAGRCAGKPERRAREANRPATAAAATTSRSLRRAARRRARRPRRSTRSSSRSASAWCRSSTEQAGGTLLARVGIDPPPDRARARHGRPAGPHPRRRSAWTRTSTSSSSAAPRWRAAGSMPGHHLADEPGRRQWPRCDGIPTTSSPPSACPRSGFADDAARRGRGARLHRRRRRVGRRHAPDRDRSARHADELLTRQEIAAAARSASRRPTPRVVDEVVPDLLSLGEVQRVLQNLLRERVSIRDLGDDPRGDRRQGARHPRPGDAGRVRAPGARPHDHRAATSTTSGLLHAITLDPSLEQEVAESLMQTPDGEFLAIDPDRAAAHRRSAARAGASTRHGAAADPSAVLGRVRRHLRRLVRAGAARSSPSVPTTRSSRHPGRDRTE